MYEAAGAGAATRRDERLGLAQVVADAAEGRGGGGGGGRVRRRIHQLRERTEGGADAAGNAARVQRDGDLIMQQEDQTLVLVPRRPIAQAQRLISKSFCGNV